MCIWSITGCPPPPSHLSSVYLARTPICQSYILAIFFSEFFRARGASDLHAHALSGTVAFAVIGAGAVGSVLAGRWADRLGRERITIWAMAVSGTCALLMGWLLAGPTWLAVGVGLVWGFAVVADSAQFSAVVTEVAPEHAVGTALTLQTALGFLLTSLTIAAVPHLRDSGGWPLAFGILAVGPGLGIMAMHRLKTSRFGAHREHDLPAS